MKKLIICVLFIVGCTPNIQDRDFELEEAEYIKKYGEYAKEDPLWANPSADSVFLTRENNVTITIHKTGHDDYKGIPLQKWQSVLTNHNDYPICVFIVWKLMDFEIIDEIPGFRYIEAKESIVGFTELKQTLWHMDGIRFALPPSGYIENMIVELPNSENKSDIGVCDFFEKDEDIVEM